MRFKVSIRSNWMKIVSVTIVFCGSICFDFSTNQHYALTFILWCYATHVNRYYISTMLLNKCSVACFLIWILWTRTRTNILNCCILHLSHDSHLYFNLIHLFIYFFFSFILMRYLRSVKHSSTCRNTNREYRHKYMYTHYICISCKHLIFYRIR